ncbi:hypothetical protein [Seonamhaeicola aphaedonensis]|uniref:Uncharacterized protein n=1 Tax=Seonamhaeicola aphaedonensis TaxID=1461338 RepID=A0A3D9H5D8_9FLAO|nr:hypothetical protein [Seonamhaeicola aphaedonensis]RED44710.1 hypothetical protein DFQ02_11012 [Seonamhaeicola aphaedonensis]
MTTSKKNQGVIILLENEKAIRDAFAIAFEDHEIDLHLVQCETPNEYEVSLKKAKEENNLRGLIIDLSNTSIEEDSRVYRASEYIQAEFDHNRIPIFIHSGNLEHYNDLKDKGTVFRTPKSAKSIEGILTSLKKMQDSGFLNIFCLGGELESRIMKEIHSAFVSQFKDKEIEGIIDSIERSCEPENLIGRTHEVFERIALRTVFENLVSASKLEDGNIKEVQLNSIEHYYRRTSDFDFWTGDIFKAKEGNNRCVILTPRCNIGHKNYDELLLCKVQDISEQNLKDLTGRKGEEKLRKNITDHQIVGERYRFLPPTPQFSGGLVDFKTNFTMSEDSFKELYELELTLSDELTNDVVRKYASYVLRGGISETEFREAHHYVKMLLPEEKD